MPISATGNSERGFTLVELMAVLAILALASAAVVFAKPDDGSVVRAEAESFAARALAARDLAIGDGRSVRLNVTTQGYNVDERRGGLWTVPEGKAFSPARWKPGTLVEGQGSAIFDPTGIASDTLAVTLIRDGAKASVTFDGSGASHVAP